MTNKKDTIIARYDVAFSISQESKRAQRYLYEDLTDEYRKNIQQWIFTPRYECKHLHLLISIIYHNPMM